MASHSIWTGSISFGLVTIPVSMRTAVEDRDLKFSMLDKDDLSPVGYQHVNKRTGKEVEWKDIVKGYQYKKGKYVVLTQEDFKRANVKANQLIEIEDFVDVDDVDPIYFEKPYYLVPTEQGVRAYELLREALSRSSKIGIGRLVMHGKQHVVAIVATEDVLMLEMMRFSHEVRPTRDLDMPAAPKKVSDREVEMAQQLITGMSSRWKPEKYKDTYYDDLMRLIEKKIKRGATAEVEPYNEPEEAPLPKGKVLDLMPLLKASLSRGRHEKDEDEDEEKVAPAKAGKVTSIKQARAKRAAATKRAKTPRKTGARSSRTRTKTTRTTARRAR
jgi:DNA end-binding protein Ku